MKETNTLIQYILFQQSGITNCFLHTFCQTFINTFYKVKFVTLETVSICFDKNDMLFVIYVIWHLSSIYVTELQMTHNIFMLQNVYVNKGGGRVSGWFLDAHASLYLLVPGCLSARLSQLALNKDDINAHPLRPMSYWLVRHVLNIDTWVVGFLLYLCFHNVNFK